MENENQPVLVTLEPEDAEAFPTSKAVNEALKMLIQKTKRPKLTAEQVRDQIDKVYGGEMDEEDRRVLEAMRHNIAKVWDEW